MKKIFLLLLTVCAMPTAMLAQENVRDTYVSLNFGIPIVGTVSDYESRDSLYTTGSVSVGFGASAAHYFTLKVGVYADIDFIFPMTIAVDADGSQTYARDDFDSLFGVTFLLAPSFAFIRNERMLLALSPGFHYMYLSMDQNVKELGVKVSGTQTGHYFGLGANLEFGYKLTQLITLRAALSFAFDFAGTEKQTFEMSGVTYNLSSEENSDYALAFMFQPRIGVGFNF